MLQKKKASLVHEDLLQRIDMLNDNEHDIGEVYKPVKKSSLRDDELFSNDVYNEADYVEEVKEIPRSVKIMKAAGIVAAIVLVIAIIATIVIVYAKTVL